MLMSSGGYQSFGYVYRSCREEDIPSYVLLRQMGAKETKSVSVNTVEHQEPIIAVIAVWFFQPPRASHHALAGSDHDDRGFWQTLGSTCRQ
jgi:hypothetical protein